MFKTIANVLTFTPVQRYFCYKKRHMPWGEFQSLLIYKICGIYSLAAFHLSAKEANESLPKLSHIK